MIHCFSRLYYPPWCTALLHPAPSPQCKFSNGGQYFAAVTPPATIFIYSTYVGTEALYKLSGHSKRVTDLCWSPNDNKVGAHPGATGMGMLAVLPCGLGGGPKVETSRY